MTSDPAPESDLPASPRGPVARALALPIVQFLLLGAVVFALVTWQSDGGGGVRSERDASGPNGAVSRTIRVTRDDLLAYVQLRTQSADAEAVAREFDALDEAGRQSWIGRYVREEALVREARRLGLDRDDDLIRRRLVQQMEFIAEDLADRAAPVTRAELEAAYRARAEDYREPGVVTFTHVFVRDGDDGRARIRALAARLAGPDPGARPRALGDRFLYHRRYVERTLDEVDSHFGAGFAARLREIDVDAARWQGPIRSEHGWHLVRLTDRIESMVPSLEEIEPALVRDLMQDRNRARVDAGLSTLVDRYEIALDDALSDPAPPRRRPVAGGID